MRTYCEAVDHITCLSTWIIQQLDDDDAACPHDATKQHILTQRYDDLSLTLELNARVESNDEERRG